MKLKSLLVGIAGGSASGLTGIGGGTVLVPLLTGTLKMPQRQAHATSLAIVISVGIAAVIPYLREGHVQWSLVLALGGGAILGAQIGARTMHNLPDVWLKLVFACFLFLVGIRMITMVSPEVISDSQLQFLSKETILALVIGLTGGAFGGLLGIGGGTLFVPALVLLLSLNQLDAQGVSLIVVVLTAISGTITNVRAGFVDKPTVLWVAPSAIVVGFLAGLLAQNLDETILTRLFGLVVLYVGGKTILSTARTLRSAR